MGDESEWLKLPTDEKVQHKAWKARVAGYKEASTLFQQIDDDKSPEFNKYAGLMKKFVTDSNVIAQEKALEAVTAFVENAAVAQRIAQEVVGGVVSKCLSATKQGTRESGKEIIMLYIEQEKQEVVEDCLIGSLENKNPKVVVSCIVCLREALRDFGNKIMMIKPMIKLLPKLLDDRDKNVREETKQLVIEMYRWVGAAIKPKLVDFKPLQVAELEAEFEKLPNVKPQQARFLRSQQDMKEKQEERAAAMEAGEEVAEEEGAAEDVDPYDLIEAVNIIPLIPKDFFEKVEAKKWQERREALEALQKLVENPKIEPGDHAQLVRVLLKVVAKDTNVMLVTLAAKCIASLAKGLRKKFSSYAPNCYPVIFDKFKEKKPNVVAALREVTDAAFFSINLEVIMEDLLPALDHKNPNIKAETVSFLARCFQKQTLSSLPKKHLKAFCASLLKTVNDTALEVREASFLALGTVMKVVTEKNVAPFLVDIDSIKLQKIKDCCEKAVLLNAKGEPRVSGGAKAPVAGSSQPKPVAKPADKAPGGKAQQRSGAPSRSGPKKAGGAAKSGKPAAKKAAAKVEEKVEKVLSDEAFLEKAEELLSAAVLAQLENSNWKERLDGMEKFTSLVKGMARDDIPTQVFVRAVCKKPGLKETNFQVLKGRIELISYLAQNAVFTNTTAEFCLGDLVDKVGDVKNGSAVQEAFSCIAEATSLEFVSSEVVNKAFSGKNPKNQSESLVWLSKAITEFGMKIQIKQHLDCLKKAFAATNPAVRTAAIAVVTTLYLYMGPQLRMLLEGEKAALLQQIDVEFEKLKGQKPPTPTRGAKVTADDDADGEEAAEGDDGKEEDLADLVPRNDIGEKFTEELLESLSDKNWKVRGEGLAKISAILAEAKFITGNLGGLPEAIKARLGDANKILITTTIGICATLAVSMGRHCKQHVKIIGPALIGCLADMKPQIRSAAVGALNAWVDQTTLTPLVEVEAFSDALKLENPNMRQELLAWLIERLPSHKPLPRDEMRLCIPHLLGCLEDRNGEVRKKAQEALVPFMIHVGYDSVYKATSKLKPVSKDPIVQILEKARESLPAKPQKTKKAAAAKAAPDDYQMDEPDTAPPKKKCLVSEQAENKPASKGAGKTKAKPAAPASKKKKTEEDSSPSITITETKDKRFKDEKGQKIMKWNFVDPRLEFVEQLKLQMEKNFNKPIMDQLFHKDFKQHIKAIEKLIKCMDELQNEQIANLDLILKWFTLRFFETNPSMLNKGLEYLQGLFSLLGQLDYHLHDLEANSFMPYLIIKVGENKDNVRRDVRGLFKLIYKVYPASKMFVFISDGIKSKNSKQRTECLEELGYLIETYGITICQPTPGQALKLIAGQISDRDNGVRNAALNTTVIAYLILGEASTYKHIGVLNEKEQSYLDERIKRSSKNKPAPAQANNRPKTAPQQPQRSATQGQIQRPATAMPKSASSNTIRKEFQLEVEPDSLRENYTMPELHQFSNLDEILQPVAMPKIKARPPSPGPRFMNSADMANTISFVISQVTNSDISICIQALAQIDEVLMDRDKVKVMVEHVGQLLIAMTMQFKMAYSNHMGDENVSKDDLIRLYRCLLGTLLSLFQNSSLATQATKDILKELINNLVTMLLDNRLMELEDGPQIVRSVNVLVVKIVEKSDQTNVLCALIRLLQECAASETCSNNFLELIMKCLWKIVRMLPDTIKELNLDRVLYDTHLFMKAFPLTAWKDRSNDLPLRTVKTILHSMVKLKGSKILSHLGSIDAGEVSEVKNYLQKVLRNEGILVNVEAEMNGTDDNKNKTPKSRRLSRTTHDMLTEIFKKVGSKENTKEGLQDLYDFKRKYPEADLDPFLKKSSHFFQNYIERGLKSIETERAEKSHSTQPTDSSCIPVVTSDGVLTTSQPVADRSVSADYLIERAKAQRAQMGGMDTNSKVIESDAAVNPVYYMERLRMLRAQCGLDSNVKEEEPPSEPAPEPEPPSPPNIMTIQGTAENMEDSSKTDTSKTDVSKLKERLARIKQMANS